VFGKEELTYKQLNEKANKLGHYLQKKGVKAETLVGICVERSLDMIVGLLGILKAGGAYVPFDPNYPTNRINYMLQNSKTSYLITKLDILTSLSGADTEIIYLDKLRTEIEQCEKINLNNSTNNKDLLYVIYTSGSTGKPKGVMGSQEGLINRLFWGWENYPFKNNEICCQKTSISFVDHVAEVFAPLLKGIPLHIISDTDVKDVENLISILINSNISRIVVVPSLLQAILKIKRERNLQLKSLRYVFCSGESLSLLLAKDFYSEFKNTKLINIYGSSEVSADVTSYEINRFNEDDVLQYFNNLYISDTIGGFDDYKDTFINPSIFTTPDVKLDFIAEKFNDYNVSKYPISIEEYYRKLNKDVLPYIINTASPRYIGHMTSALPDYVHDISKLISKLNQNLVKVESSKSLIFLEREALAMLHKSFYLFSDEFYDYNIQKVNNNLGVISTGGTISNLTALLTARNKKLFGDNRSENLKPQSIYNVLHKKGYKDFVVLGSKLMHYSINKASSILGLGMDNVIYVKNDLNGSLDIEDLQNKINECKKNKFLILAIVGIAGATETGNIDPLEEIGKIAELNDIHFHVDAAWGGALIFSDKYKTLLNGVAKADSITLCGHKQLYLPQGISICLFKDPLQAGYGSTSARYQATPDTFDFGRFTIEGSRSALSLCLHASLRLIGKKGYELLVNNGIDKAKVFADIIDSREEFELIKHPQINIVNYRYIPLNLREKVKTNSCSMSDIDTINNVNTKIQEYQFYKGKTFVSKTTLDVIGKGNKIVVLRVVLSNPLTTNGDIIDVIKDQLEIANELFNENNKLEIEKSLGATKNDDTEIIQRADIEDEEMQISIGKPLSNIKAYILDVNNNLVPIGVSGELCISGVGLSRGYLGNSKLTKEKFIDNPHFNGEKIYKTGDLARYLPDGNIEFLGRIDDQVKIRGYRIELGEIEFSLNKLEGISASVVIAKNDKLGNKYLAAYIVQSKEVTELSIEKLRKDLSKSLPDYMVPSLFVKLETLPLTPNGKIDKKTLPDPEGNIETTNEYVAPRNEIEQKLADIWIKVLGVERVGVYDNFFELGGHSLLATQVISKIRTEFNNDLPVKALFENSTIKTLSEQIDIGKLDVEQLSTIPVSSRDRDIPLSFAQERLWFIDQYEHNASYNIPGAVKLIGKLDVNVLEKTFSEIIRRHEALRTNIVTINGVVSQLIHKESKFELKIVDQTHLPEGEANQKIKKLIEIESQRPFDLTNDSLIRLVLYKISDEEHILFLNQHHIISDGWSFSVFLKEISVLYKVFSENRPSPLPELEIQYADYAVWQRKYVEGEILTKQSGYWKNKLSGTAILELPADRTRSSEQTFNGANLYFTLDKGISDHLNEFSQENDATLFMTLLSAFNVLLNRYTGQDDICVGSPIANRTRSELEPLIGFFVNTLALRSDLSGGISFVDLIKQVRQTTLDAYGNQDIPFEKVVDTVQPERNLAYSPLFQVMMVLQNNPTGELSFGDLRLSPIEFESNASKFDLTVNFTETAEGLIGGIEYNTDLFGKDRIERMIGHLNVLLESIISNPTGNIAELEILTSAEKHKLLVEWNDTEVDYPKDKCIHQLFEEQVEKTPANIAVVFEDNRLTYRELNKRANQLARYLQSGGVKPDSLVGICVDRSLEMIIGVLGILKAGGAYVPIDPTYPKDRVSYMLEDAECEIVLTQEHLELPKTNSGIIYLDAGWGKIENEPDEDVKSEVKSDNLAYVIYTSGTTGKPKGTEITHRNVNRLVSNAEFNFLRQRNKVLQYAPISFDASIFEIWGTICNGSSLIVCPEGNLSLEELDQIINNSKITVLWLTSGLFSAIVENNIKLLRNIKYLLAGGDVLNINHIEKILKEFQNISMINGYGPTEGTTFTTLYFMNKNTIINGSIPIGKPIDNTKTYVLDKEQKLLAVGVPGELYISGDGLAIGYLKRPELTAEKFIKNPYSDDPNSRLYKTGDLVKYLPDGNIEFIGRIDNQVKIRGFRIELGEVEVVLNKIETIKDCVVVAKEDANGNKRLLAYVVAGDEINIQEIRDNLSKSLPDYMVPSLFVSLQKMPLTPNGKIDRKSLPEPEGNIETINEYVAPRNETERKLADIWAKVLGVEKVGIYDNFFELGGHSLLATQVISKIRTEFNKELPLKVLFENSTIIDLSKQIDSCLINNKLEIIKKTTKKNVGQNVFENDDVENLKTNIEEFSI